MNQNPYRDALNALTHVMSGTQKNRTLGFVTARHYETIKEALSGYAALDEKRFCPTAYARGYAPMNNLPEDEIDKPETRPRKPKA